MNWKNFGKPAAPPAAAAPATQPAAVAPPAAPATISPPAAAAQPATLPPLTQPADTQPPAAPAAPKTRGRPRTVKPADPAMVAATASEMGASVSATAAPAAPAQQPVATTAIVIPPGGGMLAQMLAPKAPVRIAAAAITEAAESGGGEPNIFPTLVLSGGPTGGALQLDEMNEEHSDDDLQEGRRPIYGVLFGFRYNTLVWPKAAVEGAPKSKPSWRAALAPTGVDDAVLLQNAFAAYQFRARQQTAPGQPRSFDDDVWDPLGHPSANVELLIFEAKAGLMCVKTTWTYDSFISTNKQIAGVYPDGAIKPVPVKITPVSEKRSSKSRDWMEHYLAVGHSVDPDAHAAWQAFGAFAQQAGGDPDLNEALTEWSKHTLTDQQREALSLMADQRR